MGLTLKQQGYNVVLVRLLYNSIKHFSGYGKEYFEKNKSKIFKTQKKYRQSAYYKKYVKEYKSRKRDSIRKYHASLNDKLADCIVVNNLSRSISRENITPELIELTKIKIKLQRKINSKKNESQKTT